MMDLYKFASHEVLPHLVEWWEQRLVSAPSPLPPTPTPPNLREPVVVTIPRQMKKPEARELVEAEVRDWMDTLPAYHPAPLFSVHAAEFNIVVTAYA